MLDEAPSLLQDRFRINWLRFRKQMTGEEDDDDE